MSTNKQESPHYMTEIDVAIEWYEQSQGQNSYPFQFMALWIAFNFLYSEERADSERGQIRWYCRREKAKLMQFNPFKNPEFKDILAVFYEAPVKTREDSGYYEERYRNICNVKLSDEKRTIDLIQTIYSVRCNLFHGNKSFSEPRDQKLVQNSTILLREYMKQILPKKE